MIRKPLLLQLEGKHIKASTWVKVNTTLIAWLVESDYLKEEHLPVKNARGTRNLIVSATDSQSGEWRKAVDGFWVDVRYGSTGHLENIIALLKKLEVTQEKATLTFRDGEEINLLSDTDAGPSQLDRIEAKVDRIEELVERTDRRWLALTEGFVQISRDLLDMDQDGLADKPT